MRRRHLTCAGAALLILGAALATGSGPVGPRAISAHAQRLADGKIITIRLDTTARVFDLSPTGGTAPPGWMAPSFDDSSWDHVVAVNCRTLVDGVHYNSDYWGPRPGDYYMVRQTFFVPKAIAYDSSELDFAAVAHLHVLALNGRAVISAASLDRSGYNWTGRLAIARYLHPGMNVVTASGDGNAGTCTSISYVLTLRMTGLQRPKPVVLSWRKVPGAGRYYLQVWLVKAAPGQTITPDSQVNITAQTTGLRYTLDAAAMPAGTYQWRMVAVGAHGSLISNWTPAQTISLN